MQQMLGQKQAMGNTGKETRDEYQLCRPIYLNHAAEVIMDNFVIYDNGPVYALVGNGYNPSLKDDISSIKGPERQETPVAWTVPFEHDKLQGIFKTDQIKDKAFRSFLENPDELNSVLGALAFLRGPVDLEVKERNHIPDCVVHLEQGTVQNYSPVGNHETHALIDAVIQKGGEPVMTSANYHGKPEITTEAEIDKFREATGLYMVPRWNARKRTRRFRSSYPIVEFTPEGLKPVRSGFTSLDVLHRLISDFPVAAYNPNEVKRAPYPKDTVTLDDLPKPDARGSELRKHILDVLGLF
jgi:tRNA A37 threonylcarbamoyladenosine synthetase subunit TsaC/SUA5/YrdC